MEFKILGPLEGFHGDKQLRIGGRRQQIALAMMLLELGKVIPLSRLIDAMWDCEPPVTARAQVQICISNLRRTMTAAGGPDLIDTHSHGYLIRSEGSTLDLHAFEAAAAEGRQSLAAGNPAEAVMKFRAALGLWRGPALCDIPSTLVQNSVAHINEHKLTVLESCLQAELLSGQFDDVAAELVKLTSEYPLRERLRALQMTVLYRVGRQAEALEVYRSIHSTLTSELGIEPSRELQDLHQVMLHGDQLPECPGVAMTRVPAVPAVSAPPAAVPRLLPADIPDFTGRATIVDGVIMTLTAATSGGERSYAVPVSVLSGPGGAGKTTLAVHIAHRLADQFPDGQLFARLRDGDRPAGPYEVLGRFLRALGVEGSSLPDSVEERAEMYRDLLSSKQVLVALDDVMSQEQVSPLLPGSSTCAVLITSRMRLTGLSAVQRYEVGAFTRRSALELLARVMGAGRIQAEPDAADTLCQLCGDRPLALRIVAARLAARPHWSVAALADRLADESRRLDELSYGDMGVRDSIAISYGNLSKNAQRLLRLLALIEAPDFEAWVGAPLLETDTRRAAELIEELAESYLIDARHGPVTDSVRYRFHDITRPFARERLLCDESPEARYAALARVTGDYRLLRPIKLSAR